MGESEGRRRARMGRDGKAFEWDDDRLRHVDSIIKSACICNENFLSSPDDGEMWVCRMTAALLLVIMTEAAG